MRLKEVMTRTKLLGWKQLRASGCGGCLPGPARVTGSQKHSERCAAADAQRASVEAARCLMCFDAPETHACLTHIDIPKFIRKFNGNLRAPRAPSWSQIYWARPARECVRCRAMRGACVVAQSTSQFPLADFSATRWIISTTVKLDMFRPASAPK